MALKIKRTGASDYGQFVKALICGDPGAGKTLISSTFPNPFYASAEAGLMAIADRGIPYTDVESSDDLIQVRNSLSQDPEFREEILGFAVDTIVVDTLDEIQKILKKERLTATKQTAFQLQDWGWLDEQMRAMIRSFRNMPINVVFTCHVKEVNDNESGRVWHKPALQGSIGDDVAQYFDLSMLISNTVNTETVDGKLKKTHRRILTASPSLKYPFLKDRSGKLPDEIEVDFATDYQRIHEAIFGQVSLPDTETFTVETPEPKKLIETAPEPAPEAKKEEPKAGKLPTPSPVKEKPAPAAEVAPKKETNDSGVTVLNTLPAGVVATPHGYGTDLYCEVCGGEVETQNRAELSRIRHRKILDDKCFEAAKG